MNKLRVHIRWMIRRDVVEVLEIGELLKRKYSEKHLLKSLRSRNNIGWVAEYNEQVVGFMIYNLYPKTLSIKFIAVHPEYQHRGVASQFLNKLHEKLGKYGRNKISCKVRETNLPLQQLLKKHGFKATKIHDDYYINGDACYVMQRTTDCIQPTIADPNDGCIQLW